MEDQNVETGRLLVTVPEGAAMLSVSRATLDRIINRGEIGACRIGKAVRVSVADLKRWAAEQQQNFQIAA